MYMWMYIVWTLQVANMDLQGEIHNDLWDYFHETYIPEEHEVSIP